MTNDEETDKVTYSVKATFKDGSMQPYLIYDGWKTTEREIAETNCNSCNERWGDKITYELITNKPI